MSTTQIPRRAMRDRVHPGQRWMRRRGREIAVIRQVHRADRCVELLGIDGVRMVTFNDLRTYYTEVES